MAQAPIPTFGEPRPPWVVAEISANHHGSLAKALETISAAKACGADAVKIQTYTADTMTIDSSLPDFRIQNGLWAGTTLYNLYQGAQTPYEWHPALFDHAKKQGIVLFSTPFDETAVELLEGLGNPVYKIASFELVDIPLIQNAARTGKPMILSSGMASAGEIEEAVAGARASGCNNIAVLHCVSSYPTPMDQANLRRIPDLAARIKVPIGLSDHTLGIAASVAAVALGACVIEKHFTLSRADRGPDSAFSLEPAEMERLCREVRAAWAAVGTAGNGCQNADEKSKVFRRSIYFVKDLPAGHVVQPRDIRRIRPGFGLPPKYFQQLLGRRLKRPVSRGTPASWDLFDEV